MPEPNATIRIRRRILRVSFLVLVLYSLVVAFYFLIIKKEKGIGPNCDQISEDRGPLIIKSNSVVTLRAGGRYEYSSILIHKGAVLEFVGEKPEWTVLRSKGNFWLEGSIRLKGFDRDSIDCEYDSVSEGVKFRISHCYGSNNKGGNGGAGGRKKECAQRSCFMLSCLLGYEGSIGKGGQGGNGMSSRQFSICSKNDSCKTEYLLINQRNILKDPEKSTKCFEDNANSKTLSPGKGGEKGGEVGSCGGLLYIATCGNFIGENGTIDVSGSKGRRGEDGESGMYTGGGGAGGGPGGNGGKVYLNVTGNISLPTINTSGGPGGDGGKGGKPHHLDGLISYVGMPGEPGQAGKRGGVEICQGDCNSVRQGTVTSNQ